MLRVLFLFVLAGVFQVQAVPQDQQLSETEIRERVDAISKTLRCVVCQNQSIYESNAPLAEDMRRTVEARVRAGDTDDEVREYLREPYGDFILMRPPFQASTLILWLAPIALVIGLLAWFLRRKNMYSTVEARREIGKEDRERLDRALWSTLDEAEE